MDWKIIWKMQVSMQENINNICLTGILDDTNQIFDKKEESVYN